MNAPKNIWPILVIAFLLETGCVTYGLYLPALIGYLSIIHTVSGLIVAWALLWTRPSPTHFTLKHFSFTPANRFRWLLTAMVMVMMIQQFERWKADIPLDFHDSDMLPIIQKMCMRFLSGQREHVYDIIPEIWGGIQPIYLPAMWMPFAIPLWLHLDMRWITVMMFFFVFLFFIWKLDPVKKHAVSIMFATFLLFWWLFADNKAGLVPYTEEGVVIFFYVLLVMALHRQNAWLTGLAISMCVLSRYVLIGWIPAYILFLLFRKQYKDIGKIITVGATCFILLVLLPFGWGMIQQILALPAKYIDFTRRVWHDSPHVFAQSLGWAKFFGEQRIEKMHYVLMILSLGVPTTSMIVGLELHKRFAIPLQNLPLVILKVTMVIFYSFIDVPYLYLYYTSSYVSLIAITYFIMQEDEKAISIT